MARLLVINIDDNETAKAVIDAVMDIQGRPADAYMIGPMLGASGATLEGVFARPTQFCECTDVRGKGRPDAGWSRTKRFGWWVHVKCKKPSKMASSSLQVLHDGNNIINEYLT
jgi:hypothetical protein